MTSLDGFLEGYLGTESMSLTSSSSCSSSSSSSSSSNVRNDEKKEDRKITKDPEATTFINSYGEKAEYFFTNNPWKFSDANKFQKIFRHCICCGENRFPDDKKWKGVISIWGPPAICEKRKCYDALAYISGFVPEKHLSVETLQDKIRAARVSAEDDHEFYESIPSVVTAIRFDRVYNNESEMPKDYIETFKKLEKVPVRMRLSKIDSVYVKYQKEHNVKAGKCLSGTTDPFLKTLAEYRIKCVEVLKSLEKKQAKL